MITCRRECFRVFISIERISQKQRAEEHDLSNEKHPHAERASFALLLHVLKVMLQRAVRAGFVSCGYCFRHVFLKNPTTKSQRHKLIFTVIFVRFLSWWLFHLFLLFATAQDPVTMSTDFCRSNFPTICLCSGGANSYAS